MSVKLRLRRMGRKKLPVFAVVAADSRSPRDGRYIEDLGRYLPLREPSTVELKEERILYWLSQGAQPSDTVRNLLSREGVLLAYALRRSGKSDAEIEEAVAKHREYRHEKIGAAVKETPAARRQRALEDEKKRVAKQEEEAAKARAEADAKAKKEAEEAKKKAAEERAAAAAEARRAQEEANVAQGQSDTDDDKAESRTTEEPATSKQEQTTSEEAAADAGADQAEAVDVEVAETASETDDATAQDTAAAETDEQEANKPPVEDATGDSEHADPANASEDSKQKADEA